MDNAMNFFDRNIQNKDDLITVLNGLINKDDMRAVRAVINEVEPEDLAEVLREFDLEEKLKIFGLLETEQAAVVLDDTDPQTRTQILQNFDKEKLADILDEMPADEAADFIEEVPEDKREGLLDLMERDEAQDVEEILSYPEDSAGRVMTPNFLAINEEDDVETALARMRNFEINEDLFYIFVVDKKDKLKGLVPIRKFLCSSKDTLIKNIMDEDVHFVMVDADQEEAAEIMKKYDIFSLPVIAGDGKLIGRITADDIIDVIEEEHADDISKMTGIIEEERGYETTFVAAKNRLPWLVTCMLGSILTGLVIQAFEVTLAEMIALVSFIPVITATGGNSGVQSSTVVVRGIALGNIDFNMINEEIWRQFKIALSLGIVCGFVLTVISSLWKGNNVLGLIAGLSIFLVVIWSNFVGVVVPLIFKKLNMDPAIASGPLITTMNDIIGVFIYLSVASVFLG